MSLNRAKEHLAEFGLDQRIILLEESSATVELAAKALGCAPERIAKTLSFLVEDKPVLIVCAGDAKIANGPFKRQFHVKPRMIEFGKVEELTGHAAGGVCPFGAKPDCTIYLDESLKRFDTVFPACGTGNSAIELTLEELKHASNYSAWVDVCKGWQTENA